MSEDLDEFLKFSFEDFREIPKKLHQNLCENRRMLPKVAFFVKLRAGSPIFFAAKLFLRGCRVPS